MQPQFTQTELMMALPLCSFLFTLAWIMMLLIADKNNNQKIKDILVFVCCAFISGLIGCIIANPANENDFYAFCARVGLVLTVMSLVAFVYLIKRYKNNKKNVSK